MITEGSSCQVCKGALVYVDDSIEQCVNGHMTESSRLTRENRTILDWPGDQDYFGKCRDCCASFSGPKRAARCWPCQQKAVAKPEKFVSPSPPPTPYESELLIILAEECAEVAQRATKMLRFGVEEVQPGQALSNKQRLCQELGDLVAVVRRLDAINITSPFLLEEAARLKEKKLDIYMQTTGPEA